MSFTTEVAGAFTGPDWLRERRSSAAARLAGRELPTSEEEVWRYSPIDDLDLDDFTPATAAPSAAVPAELSDLVAEVGERSAFVAVVNGHIVHEELSAAASAQGLRVGGASSDLDGSLLGGILDGVTPASADEAPDFFITLNDAFAPHPVVVDVPANVTLAEPVVVAHWATGDGVAAFPRVLVRAGANSDVRVVEVQASGPEASLVVPMTEIVTERDARVGYVTLQALGQRTWQIGRQASTVDANATLRTAAIGFGGDFARLRTDCRMIGRGATGNLDAIFFGEGDQTLDFRTSQDHVAPDCTSSLLFKGAVGGRSRSVYTGLIRVGKDARGTNAFQTNRNVKLSEEAWAESVPNLVIENNDVRCSHASAVGPIDEDQRFYLESRGVPTDEAERLVVSGFFDEVLRELPAPALSSWLRSTIAAKFARREVS